MMKADEGVAPVQDVKDMAMPYMCMVGTTGPMDPVKYPQLSDPLNHLHHVIGTDIHSVSLSCLFFYCVFFGDLLTRTSVGGKDVGGCHCESLSFLSVGEICERNERFKSMGEKDDKEDKLTSHPLCFSASLLFLFLNRLKTLVDGNHDSKKPLLLECDGPGQGSSRSQRTTVPQLRVGT